MTLDFGVVDATWPHMYDTNLTQCHRTRLKGLVVCSVCVCVAVLRPVPMADSSALPGLWVSGFGSPGPHHYFCYYL